uniref:RING-type domain-containing protein n=1 Tax=Panagrellus redivivus TaxID=6233 RepID=A0A7E5A0A9_PANRE
MICLSSGRTTMPKGCWCRLCELPWNDDHFGQTCDEAALKIGVQKKQRDLERMASEAVMRKCHRCNLVFTKDEGCNKITCRCRATQCYICRAKDIDYTHFCGHPQIPLAPRTCCQKCLLWENPKTVDENAIVQVYQKAGEEPPKDIGPQKKRPRMAIPHQ